MSALASPCSAVLPLPKLPPLSPACSSLTVSAGAEKLCVGTEVGIQRQIGLDPFETRNDAGERAHVLSETRHRGRSTKRSGSRRSS